MAGFFVYFISEVCKKADNTDDTCVIADKPNCLVGTDGEAGGCAANADCPGGNAAADAPSCADSKCCCKAGATACNDPSTIKTTFCSLPGAPTGGKCAGNNTLISCFYISGKWLSIAARLVSSPKKPSGHMKIELINGRPLILFQVTLLLLLLVTLLLPSQVRLQRITIQTVQRSDCSRAAMVVAFPFSHWFLRPLVHIS